jgi:3-dehydrotetronate 4-kinase
VIDFAAIADDFTGGSDLASMIASAGAGASIVFGICDPALLQSLDTSAVVLCLKSRGVPASEARRLSSQAFHLLKDLRPRQLQFKYCSTFDSTPAGNIGPVIEELLGLTQATFTIAIPALPVNGRTQYLGHLFVNGVPLDESPLRHHPLNPMDDANLPRFFARQSALPTKVVSLDVIRKGSDAIRAALTGLPRGTVAFLDCTEDADLAAIAAATHDLPFITGGSGLASHLPQHWPASQATATNEPKLKNRRCLILSGSCSQATLDQLQALRESGIHVHPIGTEPRTLQEDLDRSGIAVLSSSAPAGQRDDSPDASHRLEREFGQIAREAVWEWDVNQVIVAGGETSGAVVEALGVPAARLVSNIAPGVPALLAQHPRPLGLTLKSGNFGGPDFFLRAKQHLDQLTV